MDITRALAHNLVASRYDEIPQAGRHEVSRALLNWLGYAIGASPHETVERAPAAVAPFAGPPQAAVPGRRERLDILNAALINSIGSHVLDFDDTHVRTVYPSAPVFPALRRRVTAHADASIGRTEARVTIALRDGRRYSRHVPHALGTLERADARFRPPSQVPEPRRRHSSPSAGARDRRTVLAAHHASKMPGCSRGLRCRPNERGCASCGARKPDRVAILRTCD